MRKICIVLALMFIIKIHFPSACLMYMVDKYELRGSSGAGDLTTGIKFKHKGYDKEFYMVPFSIEEVK